MNLHKLVVVLLVSICSACTALNTQNQQDKFETSIGQYGAALRWGRYNEAYSFHIRKDETQPEVDLEKLEKFSVASFKILERTVNPETTEIILLVEIGYYDEQFGTLRKMKQKQIWWFNEKIKRWLTEADYPDLK